MSENLNTVGREARQLLRSLHLGVLSTLSKKLGGAPFGSITPYVVDHTGCPVILISTIAEHTKNIEADGRVSLLVHEQKDDAQANARLTVVGQASRMEDQDSIKARYLNFFPNARGYFDTHDFFFYRIVPEHVRFIGGFGKIHWLDTACLLTAIPPLAEQEAGILAHMNADHGENLRHYCHLVHQIEPASAEMIGIDQDGFDVRADGRLLRFDFDQPVADAQDARIALVNLARQAREKLNPA